MRLRGTYCFCIGVLTALAGCVTPIETSPDVSSIPDISAFYWDPATLAAGVRYVVQGDSLNEEHLLTSADRTHITDVSGYSTGALVVRANSDSIVVDSISTHTIFLLPPGFNFGANPPPTPLAVNALLELSSGRLLAATEKGIYYTDNRSSWQRALAAQQNIAALAFDSLHSVLYAATGDSLLTSTTQGVSWTTSRPRVGAMIRSLAANRYGRLYVGYEGSGGVDYLDSLNGSFMQFLKSQRGVRSIAIADTESLHSVGVATDESATIYDDSGKILISLPSYSTADIRTLGPSEMLVTAGFGLTHSYLFSKQSTSISGTAGEALVTALGFDGGYLAGSQNGTLFQFAYGTATPAVHLTGSVTSLLHSRTGGILAGTTEGIWSFDGTSATKLSGPYADQPKDAAPGLLLLCKIKGGLSIGNTWSAGSLYINALRTSVPITAHVIDHVDTLLTPLGGSFGETYVIRYAFENGGQIDPTLPVYWLVYYSRSAGPTIIEEYLSNGYSGFALKSRAAMVQ